MDVHWFETLEQAREIIEAWRRDDNESRPHMALAEVAPSDFARRMRDLPLPAYCLRRSQGGFTSALEPGLTTDAVADCA